MWCDTKSPPLLSPIRYILPVFSRIEGVQLKVVYLHGVGDGDTDMGWLEALNLGLAQHGVPTLSPGDVIAPQYSDLLRNQGPPTKHPKRTYNERNDHDARRAFEYRQARVQHQLRKTGIVRTFGFGRVPNGTLERIQDRQINARRLLAQVKNYMTEETIRAAVLQSILDAVPNSGRILLIGHSLGSVIAIDLLDHLPESIHVQRFITIGSPAGSEALHRGSERILKRFPYARVDDWSNFLDCYDPVTAGRGLTHIFPGAQDFGIDGAGRHKSKYYLRHPAVAGLVALSLYPGDELRPSSSGIALRLEDAEATTLLTLAYARRVAAQLDKEKQTRYEDALAILQENFTQGLLERSEGMVLPTELAQLTSGQIPALPRRWDLSETVRQITVLAFTNVIYPYDIDVGEERFNAIPDLFVDLGWAKSRGMTVSASIREVSDFAAADKQGLSTKMKVFTAAAGVALLAAGPIGIAMSGAAGVAGAAALTSGLAAFGPGGMVGGLATLGGLASTGAMVTTVAATARDGRQPLMVDPTTAAIIQVAIAHALKRLGEPYDTELWYLLAATQSELGAELNRLRPFSDDKSPTVQRLLAMSRTVQLLMRFMTQHDLMPPALSQSQVDPGGEDPVPPNLHIAPPVTGPQPS